MSAHEGLPDERREELEEALSIDGDHGPVLADTLAPLIARWLAEERNEGEGDGYAAGRLGDGPEANPYAGGH